MNKSKRMPIEPAIVASVRYQVDVRYVRRRGVRSLRWFFTMFQIISIFKVRDVFFFFFSILGDVTRPHIHTATCTHTSHMHTHAGTDTYADTRTHTRYRRRVRYVQSNVQPSPRSSVRGGGLE